VEGTGRCERILECVAGQRWSVARGDDRPKSRYMFAASQRETFGLATMLGLKDSSDEGYWGVYRHG